MLVAQLPASATGIYYRDAIGNVSTSRARVEFPEGGEPFTLVEIFPRHLLFGGWKTQFYFGYVAPLREFLGISKDGVYTLTVPFGTTLADAVVDSLTTVIILPEGCSDIHVSGIEDITESRSVRRTYLDTSGRPVITLQKSNLVAENSAEITITYRVAKFSLFVEPILLITGFFSFFLLVIFLNRFHLTIGQDGKKLRELKEVSLELSGKLHDIDAIIQAACVSGNTKQAIDDLKEKLTALRTALPSHIKDIASKFAAFEKAANALLVKAAGKKVEDLQKEYQRSLKDLDSELTSKL
jgi:hypothetical protein